MENVFIKLLAPSTKSKNTGLHRQYRYPAVNISVISIAMYLALIFFG